MAIEQSDTEAYGNSWYAATMLPEPPRPPLASDLDVEVCVIGGGLAGLTAAREIARSGWSVVLLEARRLAASASGRNTGFVLPGFAAEPDRLIARVGFERTKDLWALSHMGLDYVRNGVLADGAAGIDPQSGWLYVSKRDNGEEFMHFAALLGDLGCEVEYWPTERVRALLSSERYFHAVHYLRAITIHPLNYALGLAAAAERDGVRIFENTPALSIDPAGVRKRIVTPGARLRASQVVLAGNLQIGAPGAAARRDPGPDHDLPDHHNAAWRAAWRSDHLPRRSQRHRACRQSLSCRRRRSADAVRPRHGVAAQSAPLRARTRRRYPENLSAARARGGGLFLERLPG